MFCRRLIAIVFLVSGANMQIQCKQTALVSYDPVVSQLIEQEQKRQSQTINLIASENYVSDAVREATSSVLTNKYAEGQPGKRYYSGCEYVDEIELLAIERCKQLFGAEHVNIQPHAGSQANMAVYMACLKPGDTIMGMSLIAGGHLTHGHGVNFSGQLYKVVQYGVDSETYLLDYDAIEKLAQIHKPKLIIAGSSAYARTIDFKRFAHIAKSVGSYLMVDIAHIAGLVAVGLHPSPFPHADFVTGTNHKTLRGPRGGFIMCKAQYKDVIDRAVMPGIQGGPLMHVIAAKAVAFNEALQPEFRVYQQQVVKNAQALTVALQALNYAIITGGTDNHLFIIDLRNKNITGLEAEKLLAMVGITVTRSCIPYDTEKPWIGSGIRLGTPAVTARGMDEEAMYRIVQFIDRAITYRDDVSILQSLKAEIKAFCAQFSSNFDDL